MLSLKLGNYMPVTRDLELQVVLRSPLFYTSDDKIPGSFIFNFTLPLTEQLKRELKFAHRPARKGKPTWKLPFELNFKMLKYKGTAKITGISTSSKLGKVDVVLPVETGEISMILRNLSLKDIYIDEVVQYSPLFTYGIVGRIYNHEEQQASLFNADIDIKLNSFLTDTFNAYDQQEFEWIAPYDGTFTISVVANTQFGQLTEIGTTYDAGTVRTLRIHRNGDEIAGETIESNSHYYTGNHELLEGDVIKIFVRATSVQRSIGLHYLNIYFQPGSAVFINDASIAESPFQDVISASYPDKNFAIFPIKNPRLLNNTPDSLFRVDMNDIKEYHSKFFPVTNYFVDDRFIWHVIGDKNGYSYILLNMFSPAPYIEFIIDKILNHIGFTAINNPFATDELKNMVYQTNFFINNYFYDEAPIALADFVPDEQVSDFLRNLCRTLGIVFDAKTVNRTIRFKFLDEIMADMSSIEFGENVLSSVELQAENYSGYILRFTPAQCAYLQKHNKTLDGLNIIGETNFALPASAELNDAIYVVLRQAWYVWQYDPEEGVFQWIFHSIDFPLELKDIDEESTDSPLEINLERNTVAMSAWFHSDDEPGAYDNSIGAPANRFWRIPMFYEAGNFSQLPEAYKTNLQGILLFYRGLQKDSLDDDYPLGSNTVYDYAGDKIPGADLSLRLDGQYGLFEKKWKNFIEWRLNSPGEYKLQKYIAPLEIHQLDWFRWHKIHGVDYLLKEIRFNIRHDRLSIAEITGFRR